MTAFLRLLPLIAGAVALAGCGGLLTSDQPPGQEYWLGAVTLGLGEPSMKNLPVSDASRTGQDVWSQTLKLRQFFTVVTAKGARPEAHVKLAGRLACGPSETAVGAATTALAREDRLAEIVAAFQQATDGEMISLREQLRSRVRPACPPCEAMRRTNRRRSNARSRRWPRP